ncbi:MAG: PilZ domain-containing protein [Candidatus Omnitrophica bacterium]|nr:PilZ domain-containing protein [Candidatus Omnitrophota bacterium]
MDASLPLKLFHTDADFITETINISSGGAYCQIDRFIPVMTKLKILMFLPIIGRNRSHKIECEGIIVRTEPEYPADDIDKYNIAIFFSNIAKKDCAKITSYVKKKMSSPSCN